MYILRKICEIGSFEVRIISPCGTFCQFGEGTIPCPSHHLFRQGVQLNNSANVSNHFQIGGGMGVLGYNKNCVAQKKLFSYELTAMFVMTTGGPANLGNLVPPLSS